METSRSEEKATMKPIADILDGLTVLVTGATGLIGLYVSAKLLRDVPKLGALILPCRGGQKRWDSIVAEEPQLFSDCQSRDHKIKILDIDDVTMLPAAMPKCDAVIHIAANVSWELEQGESDRVNCDVAIDLYRSAARNECRAFVYCSTFSVVELDGQTTPPRIVTRNRLYPEKHFNPDLQRWYKIAYFESKRRAEASLRAVSEMSKLPLVVVRPTCIGGCSALPGALVEEGWVNSGNLHVPQSYYFFFGRPLSAASPRLPFLPSQFKRASAQHTAPVDITANVHVAALAMCLDSQQRTNFRGESTPVFNVGHDQDIKRLTMQGLLELMPGFDNATFETVGPQMLGLLSEAIAKDPGSAAAKELRRVARPLDLLFPGDDTLWDLDMSSCRWLEAQLVPEDRSLWPITFTQELNWRGWVGACHDFVFNRIAQTPFKQHSKL